MKSLYKEGDILICIKSFHNLLFKDKKYRVIEVYSEKYGIIYKIRTDNDINYIVSENITPNHIYVKEHFTSIKEERDRKINIILNE